MFTVIVPFKNAAPWIRRCAESLRQLDGDMEFIFVDDNSTDGGGEIVEVFEAQDERFRCLMNENGEEYPEVLFFNCRGYNMGEAAGRYGGNYFMTYGGIQTDEDSF